MAQIIHRHSSHKLWSRKHVYYPSLNLPFLYSRHDEVIIRREQTRRRCNREVIKSQITTFLCSWPRSTLDSAKVSFSVRVWRPLKEGSLFLTKGLIVNIVNIVLQSTVYLIQCVKCIQVDWRVKLTPHQSGVSQEQQNIRQLLLRLNLYKH